MKINCATLPGKNDAPNEDWCGTGGGVAVVLDGVTAPAGLGTGCVHGVPWFVQRLGAQLVYWGAILPLSGALRAAIEAVRALHPECDHSHPGTPSATVVMCRWNAPRVDWLVLSDSTLVADLAGGGLSVIRDDSLNHVAIRERAATTRHPIGSPSHKAAVEAMVVEQRRWRNREGGYWLAASTPEAADYALTGSMDADEVLSLTLLTDGASALVDTYEAETWRGFIDQVGAEGPMTALRRVRAIEAGDDGGGKHPRFKRSDDATIVCVSR